MNPIFGTSENICNILVFFASIQLNENDGLPAQICSGCTYEANNAYFFKQKCEESDKLLRSNLQSTSAEGNVDADCCHFDISAVKEEVTDGINNKIVPASHQHLDEDDFNDVFSNDDWYVFLTY